ncbi:hypothetical protein PAAG_08974 [Paracoccidioides lutzii Pb01]|uniref:Uncharacterized protein n=1 Tax=Paracoccidioides lutzii (strain ATCC MYA-826 / Pb01) TaxID=502779 RepID=C1HDY1_PARBA|nr:hypothetical protein PAAG_08974 [Paracoccidioides lutzii Pb01]EEH40125.1 hypothetical protein PAAG_08974 [Paracoccidioides lutzii Pb01]
MSTSVLRGLRGVEKLEGRGAENLGRSYITTVSQLCVAQQVSVLVAECTSYHKHFMEPDTLGTLVDLANCILERVKRPVSWLHMPVPKSRDDVAYFDPLRDLQAGEDTRLYLGLVHPDDMEGTRRRIRAAQSVIHREFSVATECGMRRIPREELESILRISKAVTEVDRSVGTQE